MCSNAARVYVHENIYEEFLKRTEKAVRDLKIGDTMDKTATIGALINQDHFNKVSGFIERAKKEVQFNYFLLFYEHTLQSNKLGQQYFRECMYTKHNFLNFNINIYIYYYIN